jgi:hypothetical protein
MVASFRSCRFHGRKLDEHANPCDINSDMSALRTRMGTHDTRCHGFTALVLGKRTNRKEDHDCWDVAKCNKRLTEQAHNFHELKDCFIIVQ